MLTKEQIQQMFEDMGLGAEEARCRFSRFAKPMQEQPAASEQTFIFALSDTSFEEGAEDGELE